MAYAAVATGVELVLGTRGHRVLLVAQHAVLLPCAIATVRCRRCGATEIADIDRRLVFEALFAPALLAARGAALAIERLIVA